jgi:hypothetical protein
MAHVAGDPERPPHQSEHVINRSNIYCPRESAVSKPLDLPYAPNVWPQAHADYILKGGRAGHLVRYDLQLLLP